jgi:NitT/TauT family transport system substrate-binding protein
MKIRLHESHVLRTSGRTAHLKNVRKEGKAMKKIILFITLCCFAAILGACGNKEEQPAATPEGQKSAENKENPKPAGPPVKVNVGLLKLTPSAPIFIGMDKGFFKEENIEVVPQWFDAAQPVAVATASGKVDVGATGLTASIYNMVAAGQKLFIVADKGMERKGYPATAILVHKDSTINSVEDLKGKKIGITQTGGTYHYGLGRVLENHGLSLNDVQVSPLGTISANMEALKSKQIDATLLSEPNQTKALKDGYGKVLVQLGDEFDSQNAALFFSPKFFNQKEEAIRFMKAYIKSCRYYYDAALQLKDGKQVEGPNFDEVIQIIAKYTEQPVDNIKGALPYMDRNGKLLEEDIKTQIDFYTKYKLIEKTIDYKTVTDMELWKEALKQVGEN